MTDIYIRPARREDAKFMAWLILTAGRAHVTRGIWEVILDGRDLKLWIKNAIRISRLKLAHRGWCAC